MKTTYGLTHFCPLSVDFSMILEAVGNLVMMNTLHTHSKWERPTDYVGKLTTTGKGVGVVVMDDGFDTTHPDFGGRVLNVATSPQDVFDSDPVGHGTLIMGIVGGDGTDSGGEIKGVAPEADLIALQVDIGEETDWQKSAHSISAGINWAVQNQEALNIRVINCSFVVPAIVEKRDPETQEFLGYHDPLENALQNAHDAGIVVVAGAGNFADDQPIFSPAANPNVIAVGALDTNGTPQDFSDDKVADFSSRGLGFDGQAKPDILAPGVNIMSTNASGSRLEKLNARNLKLNPAVQNGSDNLRKKLAAKLIMQRALPPTALRLPPEELKETLLESFETEGQIATEDGRVAYIAQDGSSEAAPIVTGVIAHMLEVNPNLGPDEVKEILYSTARPVEGDKAAQGHGAINATRAIEEARSRLS